jgi:hypothetical protein
MKKNTLVFSTRPIPRNAENEEQSAPVKPEKDIPSKPNPNPDPTKTKPGNDPRKNDPTRIEEPKQNDPTRIDEANGSKQPNPGKKESGS